ncbi:MAG: MFS transporter, partial [Thermomicrobiales bacterium]
TNADEARVAVAAGATFLVSPVNPGFLIPFAQQHGVLPVPGTATPSEMWHALNSGASAVKVFPVAGFGGSNYLRNLLGPFPGLKCMVSGGILPDEVGEYRRAGAWCVALGATLPMLTFGLLGGVVADRRPKRQVLLASQSLIGLAALLYAALVITGVVQIWQLCLVSALEGVAFAFNMPARQAFVAQVISRERLTNAMGLHNAGSNFARIVGPLLAGSLIALPRVGPGHVYLLVALLYVAVVVGLLRLRHNGAPVGTAWLSPLRALGDGLAYLRTNAIVSTLLLLAVAPMLLGMPYQQLMPVFAKDVFDVGPRGLGLLLTINGVGALIGALTVASMTTFRRRGLLQMTLGITFGLAVAVFAFGQSFALALVVLLVVGFAWAAFQALNSSLIISNTEPGYTGRVMSVYLLTFSVMDIGAVGFGALSDRYGAPLSVGLGGLLLA